MAGKKKVLDETHATSERTLPESRQYTGMLAERGLLSTPTPLPTTAAEFYHRMYQYMACWLELFRHYQIDLPDENADFKLAQALAAAHVPAFQLKNPTQNKAHRPSKVSESDVLGFLSELARCSQKLERSNAKPPSQRALIIELKRSKFIRERRMADTTIKGYLAQLKLTKRWRGRPTDFQRAVAQFMHGEPDKK